MNILEIFNQIYNYSIPVFVAGRFLFDCMYFRNFQKDINDENLSLFYKICYAVGVYIPIFILSAHNSVLILPFVVRRITTTESEYFNIINAITYAIINETYVYLVTSGDMWGITRASYFILKNKLFE